MPQQLPNTVSYVEYNKDLNQFIASKDSTTGMWHVYLLGIGGISPIGPRLSKCDPLPDYPTCATTNEDALSLCRKWEKWSNEQEAKLNKTRKKKKRRR